MSNAHVCVNYSKINIIIFLVHEIFRILDKVLEEDETLIFQLEFLIFIEIFHN